MKRKIGNWFYKDSHLTITKQPDMPDAGKLNPVKVNMLTFSPYTTVEASLSHSGESVQLTGTYGLSPFDIFNPFKENTNIVWIMMYQQGLIKDVTAELIHPDLGSIAVTVNNPQVGKPYAVFYDNPVEMIIPSPLVGSRIDLSEGDSASWTSKNGWTFQITRNGDTNNKEFDITFK